VGETRPTVEALTMADLEHDDSDAACALCGQAEVLRWRCQSCRWLGLPSLFCSMPCVWSHGPAVHHDLGTYQIQQRSEPGA
jgi:predicted RNA-binding Zn-ribbon protein involved in translation (DUF1610 family)